MPSTSSFSIAVISALPRSVGVSAPPSAPLEKLRTAKTPAAPTASTATTADPTSNLERPERPPEVGSIVPPTAGGA